MPPRGSTPPPPIFQRKRFRKAESRADLGPRDRAGIPNGQRQHSPELEELSQSEHERELKRKLKPNRNSQTSSHTQDRARVNKGKGKRVPEPADSRAVSHDQRTIVVNNSGPSNQLDDGGFGRDGSRFEQDKASQGPTNQRNGDSSQSAATNTRTGGDTSLSDTEDDPLSERSLKQEQSRESVDNAQVQVQDNLTAEAEALQAALQGAPADPVHLKAALRVILHQQQLMSRITPGYQFVPPGFVVVPSISHGVPRGSESLPNSSHADEPDEHVRPERRAESDDVEHNEIPCVLCLRKMCKNLTEGLLCILDEDPGRAQCTRCRQARSKCVMIKDSDNMLQVMAGEFSHISRRVMNGGREINKKERKLARDILNKLVSAGYKN
ncbi:hypothetical protein NW762_011000 [Fusarium torreyae]|uniref:Uncharacterized protein n=1 Tax=Fusarium torreyae TaxID=1237075 RepID=A0A9W8RRY2_9HYPO|nr:hypothetical protein NW762_011000 [Fusarium torreyae]